MIAKSKEDIKKKQKKCKHPSAYIQEIQGGQVEKCLACGKMWG